MTGLPKASYNIYTVYKLIGKHGTILQVMTGLHKVTGVCAAHHEPSLNNFPFSLSGEYAM